MNPFLSVVAHLQTTNSGGALVYQSQGQAGALCLLMRVLADGYSTGLGAGQNHFKYVDGVLASYGENDLLNYFRETYCKQIRG